MLFSFFLVSHPSTGNAKGSIVNTTPPDKRTKLIFIHHSCGENLLNDHDGGLGKALIKNNYFVSDTNYGWGPSSIGDRTDILDWPEWFKSGKTSTYYQALLNETRIHSPYRRNIPDPGGNNRIVLFKSCFPNSNLHGRPNDPPKKGHGLTISNAKSIYNDLLSFFSRHPETLFIAVTAPPVQERTFGKNARSFNNWLVHDWLENYPGSNVGVFDFYNVLTGKNHHHRVSGSRVQHVYSKGKNTLVYFQGSDNHPVRAGNRKATEQLVPLLNMYYNNWEKNAPDSPVVKMAESQDHTASKQHEKNVMKSQESQPTTVLSPTFSNNEVANFENGCTDWVVFSDGTQETNIKFRCVNQKGKNSLQIDYKISPNDGWGVCSMLYPSPVSWKEKQGISFKLLAKTPQKKFNFIVYQGTSQDDLHHFEISITTDTKMVQQWQEFKVPFIRLKHPEWDSIPNDHIDLNLIQGVAIGFDAADKKGGTLWIDDIQLYE